MNKYLEKLAGMPGTFLAAAEKKSLQAATGNKAKTHISGLPEGDNVSKGTSLKPRQIINRKGRDTKALTNRFDNK